MKTLYALAIASLFVMGLAYRLFAYQQQTLQQVVDESCYQPSEAALSQNKPTPAPIDTTPAKPKPVEKSVLVSNTTNGEIRMVATKTKQTLVPLHDRIVVIADAAESKSKGGIVLPDSAKEKPVTGKVVAVGSGRLTSQGNVVPLEVSVGDKVSYGKYAGQEIELDDEKFVVLREDEIHALIR